MKYILLKSIQLSLRIRHKAMLSFPNTSSSAKKRVCHSCLSGNQAIGKTGAVPRGGGTQKCFTRGGSAPRSDPLPFYLPFFSEKVPLSYTFYWKKAHLSYTFLRRLMNKSLKQEVFLSFFSRSA